VTEIEHLYIRFDGGCDDEVRLVEHRLDCGILRAMGAHLGEKVFHHLFRSRAESVAMAAIAPRGDCNPQCRSSLQAELRAANSVQEVHQSKNEI